MMRYIAGAIACSVVLPLSAAAQEVSREALLDRAAAYVSRFVDGFSSVVAEETLVQETTIPRRKRTMRSDYLFVRFPGDSLWMSFRDVFDVDGKPVRDHEERLTKLFMTPSSDARRRASDIASASARFNLLDIGTINHPLLAMSFLQDIYRARFRFILAGSEKSLGPKIRKVQFQEFQTPTIIKGNSNSDVLTRGLFWLDEDTGRVAKTELRIGGQAAPISVITLFKLDETLGIDVPVEMRDWYPDRGGEIRGVATYGRYRRFQVTTEETIK
ncbi:MAG TPA: hypothetical protein VFB85_10415 [Vicinamibacterales bacterium]|jgi:hypothetical protein|nr:hypothetical protein [Vicinamibacterales bacterium]